MGSKQFNDLDLVADYRSTSKNTIEHIIGVDEVGRGCLFGPVTVSALTIPEREFEAGLKESFASEVTDSKLLSQRKREELLPQIRQRFTSHCSTVSVSFIEKYNISQAIKYGMYRCVQSLLKSSPEITIDNSLILFDGRHKFLFPEFRMPKPMPDIKTQVAADASCFTVGAASIIAKVERDRLMALADQKFPGYALSQNMGYATKAHRDALQKLGRSPLHRSVFLRKILAEIT